MPRVKFQDNLKSASLGMWPIRLHSSAPFTMETICLPHSHLSLFWKRIAATLDKKNCSASHYNIKIIAKKFDIFTVHFYSFNLCMVTLHVLKGTFKSMYYDYHYCYMVIMFMLKCKIIMLRFMKVSCFLSQKIILFTMFHVSR